MQLIDNLKAVKASGVQIKAFKMIETHRGIAWSASVYLDGKKLGMVDNDGSGGMTHVRFGKAEQEQVMSALKKQGYTLKLTYGDLTVDEPTLTDEWVSFVVAQIGDELDELKAYKKQCKKGIYVARTEEPTFVYHKAEDSERMRAAIKASHGATFVAFLNEEFTAL